MSSDMENIDTATAEKQKRILKFLFIALLLISPLIYLYYKSSDAPNIPANAAVQNQPQNITELENAVNASPTFDNLINLGMAYINNKMPGKSIEHLEKAIQLNPSSAIAYNNLGVAYIMLEQYGDGELACARALQLDPDFQLAKNNLNWAGGEIKKINGSILLKESIANDKRDAIFYNELGLLYFKLSDYTKSIEMWNKVFEYDAKNTSAINSIGIAFMKKNQVDDAIALFKKVLELEPTNQLAKNNLVWALDVKSKWGK